MELAGLKVVVDADFSSVYEEFNRANSVAKTFAKDVQSIFNAIPDLGKKFNFTANGASQAAQDYREMARAERELAMAAKEVARAKEIEERARRSAERATARELDAYGQLVRDSNKLVREYYNAEAAVLGYGNGVEYTADQLSDLKNRAKESQDVLKKIEQNAGRFHRNVGNYASGFDPLRNSIMQISREMPAFANSMQTGFMAISNNIGPLADAIQQLKFRNAELIAQGKPAQSMFKALAGAIFSWQTLLSVGITLLTVYGADLVKMITTTKEASEAKNMLAEREKELENSIKSANASFGQQVSEVKKLQIIIESQTSSKEQQEKAYKKLQEIMPDVLKNYSLEELRAGKLAEVINTELIPALVSAAKVRVLQDEIANIYKEERDIVQGLTKDLTELGKRREELRGTGLVGRVATNKMDARRQAKYWQERQDIADEEARIEQEGFNKLLENRQKADKLVSKLGGLVQAAPNSVNLGDDPKPINKVEKEIKTIDDLYNELNKTLEVNEKLFQSKQITFAEQLEADIAAQKNLIKGLFEGFGVSADDSMITAATMEIESMSKQLAKINTDAENAKKAIDNFKASVDAVVKAQQEAKKKEADFANSLSRISTLESNDLLSSADATSERISVLKKRIEELIIAGDTLNARKLIVQLNTEQATAKIQAFNAQMSSLLQQGANGAFGAIGEAIGEAINGEKGSVMSTIANFLASILDQFGKALITFGTSIEAIQKALTLSFSNPLVAGGVAIGAGILAIGAAKLLRNQTQRIKGKNFADGGVVYGETYARVGEYSNARTNPEIIAPLDRLRSLLSDVNSGGNTNVNVSVSDIVIEGDKLRLVMERANNSWDR